jgi:hypothetical protein
MITSITVHLYWAGTGLLSYHVETSCVEVGLKFRGYEGLFTLGKVAGA